MCECEPDYTLLYTCSVRKDKKRSFLTHKVRHHYGCYTQNGIIVEAVEWHYRIQSEHKMYSIPTDKSRKEILGGVKREKAPLIMSQGASSTLHLQEHDRYLSVVGAHLV